MKSKIFLLLAINIFSMNASFKSRFINLISNSIFINLTNMTACYCFGNNINNTSKQKELALQKFIFERDFAYQKWEFKKELYQQECKLREEFTTKYTKSPE